MSEFERGAGNGDAPADHQRVPGQRAEEFTITTWSRPSLSDRDQRASSLLHP